MMSPERQSNRRTVPSVRRVTPLLVALLIGPLVRAEAQPPSETPPTGVLRIRSEPTGAIVRLYGDHVWVGSTPWDLQRGITGTYRVVAHVEGYESWKRTITIAGGESKDLNIRLSPKHAEGGLGRRSAQDGDSTTRTRARKGPSFCSARRQRLEGSGGPMRSTWTGWTTIGARVRPI
jgi:hypothetical protein